MASVMGRATPVSADQTMTRWSMFGKLFAYVSHFESGDQSGSMLYWPWLVPSMSAVMMRPLSTSMTRSRERSSTKAMRLPSGDQVGDQAIFDSPIPRVRTSPRPSWGPILRE